jgi:hypothetical protein
VIDWRIAIEKRKVGLRVAGKMSRPVLRRFQVAGNKKSFDKPPLLTRKEKASKSFGWTALHEERPASGRELGRNSNKK